MASPADRRYANTHEWYLLDGNRVSIGITRFAVDELTDVTYLEITKTEGPVQAGEPVGEIESVKATSDIYSGIAGTVIAVNQQVLDDPSIINADPFGTGWFLRIQIDDCSQLESLMTAQQYDQMTAG